MTTQTYATRTEALAAEIQDALGRSTMIELLRSTSSIETLIEALGWKVGSSQAAYMVRQSEKRIAR